MGTQVIGLKGALQLVSPTRGCYCWASYGVLARDALGASSTTSREYPAGFCSICRASMAAWCGIGYLPLSTCISYVHYFGASCGGLGSTCLPVGPTNT